MISNRVNRSTLLEGGGGDLLQYHFTHADSIWIAPEWNPGFCNEDIVSFRTGKPFITLTLKKKKANRLLQLTIQNNNVVGKLIRDYIRSNVASPSHNKMRGPLNGSFWNLREAGSNGSLWIYRCRNGPISS
jgi:hypothetical protein